MFMLKHEVVKNTKYKKNIFKLIFINIVIIVFYNNKKVFLI